MNRIAPTWQSARLLGAITLGMVLLPNIAEAQRPGGRQGGGPGGGPMMTSSVALFLEKSDDLNLTQGQTEQLTALQVQFDEDNAPLMKRIEEGRANRDREAMRSVMQEFREADQALTTQAMALLDEGQREKAKALVEGRRANRRRPPGR